MVALVTGLVLGFFLGYIAAWLSAQERKGPYEYTVQRLHRPSVEGVEDAVYLWQLRCQNRRASRGHLMKSGEMTAYRWNKASNLLEHLGLRPDRVGYQEGVRLIRQELAHRQVMGKSKNYVAPY